VRTDPAGIHEPPRVRRRLSLPVTSLLAIVGLLTAFPMLMLVGMAFNTGDSSDVPPREWGLAAFGDLNWQWVINTLQVAVPSTVLATAIGTLLAWILYRTPVKHRRVFEVLIYIPFMVGPLISTFAWIILGSPSGGLLNALWSDLTGSDGNLVNVYSITWIIILQTIVEAPVALLIVGAMMQRMDTSLEESSLVLGAGKLRTAAKVTVPLMLPGILSAGVFTLAMSLGSYAIPILIGTPIRFFTLSTAIYLLFNQYPPNYPLAAVLGLIMVVLVAIAVWVSGRLVRDRSDTTVTGRARRAEPPPLGNWRFVTTGFLYVYVFLTVVLPIGVLLLASFQTTADVRFGNFEWTFVNFHYVLFEYPITQMAIKNSIWLGVASGAICVFLAFAIAWVVQRTQGSGRTLLRQLTMLPQSIPGLICSVGVLWLVLSLPLVNLYGTMSAVLLAYVIVFLPVAYQSMAGAVGSIDKGLEEAGRTAGAGVFRVLRTVTAPLILPAMLAGWMLVFMGSIREVSTPLFLSTAYNPVLGPSILSFWGSGAVNETAALVIVQVVIIGIAIAIVQIGSRRRVEL
jgi:iron(III) transport system permease protein